jgi:5-methylcytosine-specific restriction endonuclease McrA
MSSKANPRWSNGTLRRKHRRYFQAMQAPCGICRGRLGPIHYDEPSDSKHPLSFVIDEIHPVSKWEVYGYNTPAEAAQDINNLQAAHYICNSLKGNKANYILRFREVQNRTNISDGDW